MDLTESIIAKSDQVNADDLIAGPRTVTITEVRAGSAEQPVEIVTAELGPGRPFKPSKTVRRILVAAWGPDASAYVGRRMTLYRDPNVRFGGDAVGGIRISHLSDITKQITLALTVTRGKRAPHVVQPLREEPKPAVQPANPTAAVIAEIARLADQLPGGRRAVGDMWAESHEGQPINQASDVPALEALRDSLAKRLASQS